MGFAKHMSAVIVDCVLADKQFFGNGHAVQSLRYQRKHFFFAFGKQLGGAIFKFVIKQMKLPGF